MKTYASTICLAVSPTLILFIAGCSDGIRSNHPSAPSTQSTTATTSPAAAKDPINVLRELAERPSLRFSTEDPDSVKDLSFCVRIAHPFADVTTRNAGTSVTNIFVSCHKNQVEVLCTSETGLPYSLMKPGLFVNLDHAHPGGLVVFRGGGPVFQLAASTGRPGIDFDLSYHADRTAGAITLDVQSLLRGTLDIYKLAQFDSQKRVITVESENAVNIVTVAADPHAVIPIESFGSKSRRNNASVIISSLRIDSLPLFNSGAITEESVRAIGNPVNVLDQQNLTEMDTSVPPDFGNDPREKASSEKLRSLIVVDRTRILKEAANGH